MGRDLRGNNKVTNTVKIGGDSRPATNKRKPNLKDFMQYKIATQVRADAAFLRNKKK